jgi:hypothetical protein
MNWKIINEYGSYKEIHFSPYNKTCLIDNEDVKFLENYNWHFLYGRYLIANIKLENKWNKFLFHRVIMNHPKGMVIDHINHNTFDNRRCNLRICTIQNNLQNSPPDSNRELPKGVSEYFYKKGYWDVLIKLNNKNAWKGRFSNLNAATNMYNHMAKKIHGEFAALNKVDVFMSEEECLKYLHIKTSYTSKYRGVTKIKNYKSWRAENKGTIIGSYPDELSAAKAYNEYIIKNNMDEKLNDLEDLKFDKTLEKIKNWNIPRFRLKAMQLGLND